MIKKIRLLLYNVHLDVCGGLLPVGRHFFVVNVQ